MIFRPRFLAASLAAACVVSFSAPADAQGRHLTADQSAFVDILVEDLVQASRDSFAANDWSAMANLYPEGALACWNAATEDPRFSFLSMLPMESGIYYDVFPLPGDYSFGDLDVKNLGVTHVLQVSFRQPVLEAHWDPDTSRAVHFYLKVREDQIELAFPCPPAGRTGRDISAMWRIDTSEANALAARLGGKERERLRGQMSSGELQLAVFELIRRYRIGENQAMLVLDRCCESD